MPELPVFVASDVHLGAIHPSREEAFYAWVREAASACSHLVINGDLFDFWFEYRNGIPAGYERALTLLREVVDGGLPVTLMGGNHDWWGGRYLREEIGLEFLQDPVTRTLAGHRTYIAHGDGLGSGDLGYRALKIVLRGRLTRWAFAQLGPALGDRVAGRVSRTEGRWHGSADDPVTRAKSRALREWGIAWLESHPHLDVVTLGHTHIPLIEEVEPGRWYVNTGDWVSNRTYLVLESDRPPRLLEWEG